jgi:adenylyl- and sulfurtransferase ThiI
MKSIVVHYQEIALKGNNRPWFIARLVRNLRQTMSDLDVREIRVLMGRIEIVLGPGTGWDAARERVARVFGVANFARAGRARLDVDAIAREILNDLGAGIRERSASRRSARTSGFHSRRLRSNVRWAGASRKHAAGPSLWTPPS